MKCSTINKNISINDIDIDELNTHDSIDTSKFTKRENRKVTKLIKSISGFTNDDVLSYGTWEQKKLLDICNELVTLATNFNTSKALDSIKNIDYSVDNMMYKYDSKNMYKEFFYKQLEEYESLLKKGLKELKKYLKLFRRFKLKNDYYINQLSIYIIAGEMWLSCMKQDISTEFEKRIKYLRMSRNIAIATNSQIDKMYSNDERLYNSTSTLLKTIEYSKKFVNKMKLIKPRK